MRAEDLREGEASRFVGLRERERERERERIKNEKKIIKKKYLNEVVKKKKKF